MALLRRALPASVRSLGLEGDYIFQQDNASCHFAKYTKDWMARNGITFLDWPAQSTDLNPIEHLWDALGRQLGCRAFSNNDKLWKHLQEQWQLIPRVYISTLVESMTTVVSPIDRIWRFIEKRKMHTRRNSTVQLTAARFPVSF